MNYNTVYVGMDVHKESFTLCAFTIEADKGKYHQKTEPDFKKVLKYLEFLRSIYGDDAKFVCGYEAGCLGYTLYHQLTSHDVDCKILAPTTMLEQRSRKRIKTDKRDAEIITRFYNFFTYTPCTIRTRIHIPSSSFMNFYFELLVSPAKRHSFAIPHPLRNEAPLLRYVPILHLCGKPATTVSSCLSMLPD